MTLRPKFIFHPLSPGEWRWPTAEPFSDEQAQRIRKSARLSSHEPDRPAGFDDLLSHFFDQRWECIPTKERLKLLKARLSDAIALNEGIMHLGVVARTHRRLLQELGFFIMFCEVTIWTESKNVKPAGGRRNRMQPAATDSLAMSLAGEFKRLFGKNPGLKRREGPFYRFVEAFTRAAKENLPSHEAKHIPAARTIMNHANAVRRTRRSTLLKGQKSA